MEQTLFTQFLLFNLEKVRRFFCSFSWGSHYRAVLDLIKPPAQFFQGLLLILLFRRCCSVFCLTLR